MGCCKDGITATRELCGPDVADPIPVLVLTTFDVDEYLFGALEAGASGFLLKDAEPATLVEAVRSVAAGHGMLANALTRRVLREVVTRRRTQPVTAARARELLTPRELDILLLPGRTPSRSGGCAATRGRRSSSPHRWASASTGWRCPARSRSRATARTTWRPASRPATGT
ncbi:response regulator transcription factor [Cellulomonas sp. zg-ZUI22]|uniref:response regulator transcription factor n=1 Tax=Cellulomonas sp. zg-ZUI22 TaxID=2816955 RepID=UPI0027DC849C|nr:response regulator transcription factor [Cellulomonas sp. zg-ZUI22]